MRGTHNDAYSILRKRIILGEFLPGDRLKEQTLAQELAVSRTPIRMAFRRLEADGFVVAEVNKGVVVAPWSEHDDDEVFDLRALVESHAAGLAARRAQPEHLAQLDELNAQMERLIAERPENFLTDIQQVNRQFHKTVLQAAASPRLMAFAQSLLSVERVVGAFFFYTDEEMEASLLDHRNITRAIARGDVNLAQALLDSHVRSTSQKLKDQRRNPPESQPAC